MQKVFTLDKLWRIGAKFLQSSSHSAILDSQLLLAYLLAKDKTYLFTYPEQFVEHSLWLKFWQLLYLRKKSVPIGYILGYQEFWDITLTTVPSTLIPRADTECLVEQALIQVTAVNAKVLELGTGTGAIGLALAKTKPCWTVLACDRDQEIVNLASFNAHNLGITNIQFIQSNWYSQIPSTAFDLIISNPPYVDYNDEHLTEGDVRYEPKTALVALDQGFADLCFIIKSAKPFLAMQGWLILEHGWKQANIVKDSFLQHGFQHIKTINDYNGCNRLTIGQYCQ